MARKLSIFALCLFVVFLLFPWNFLKGIYQSNIQNALANSPVSIDLSNLDISSPLHVSASSLTITNKLDGLTFTCEAVDVAASYLSLLMLEADISVSGKCLDGEIKVSAQKGLFSQGNLKFDLQKLNLSKVPFQNLDTQVLGLLDAKGEVSDIASDNHLSK